MLGIMTKDHIVSLLNTPSSKLATWVHIKISVLKQSEPHPVRNLIKLSQACLKTKDIKILHTVVTHRGDPAAWCAGSGGKYRELVLEGNQGRLKKSGFRLKCTKRAGTVPLTEIVVIPCPCCLPSNTRASLRVKRG